MAQDVSLALQLQRMDRQLVQLEAEIRGLPKKIALLEAQMGAHEQRLVDDHAALLANQLEVKRLAGSNEDHRLKIDKLKKQVMQSTTQEQLTAFNHEITFCESEIVANDESSFVLLEESERLAKIVKEAEGNLGQERLNVEQQKIDAKVLSEEDRKKGIRIFREREKLAKELPPALLKDYERLRKKHKDGIVVAECTEGLCTSCQMNIRAALLQQIRQHPEKMFYCESCLRILSFNPPRSVEGTTASTALSS